MNKIHLLFALLFSSTLASLAQEIEMTETGATEQVYGEEYQSDRLLPFNDLSMEFGYVLYRADITIEAEKVTLVFENVRDYAAVYIDGKLQDWVTDGKKRITLDIDAGTHNLQLYAENIGRITYGPEILDNMKGLFGSITLDGEDIEHWKMTPLNIRDCDVNTLKFTELTTDEKPCFYKGYFDISAPADTYLDISGWGMGEVWINGNYMGSYWEEEKQQSIQISANNLRVGKNEIVVFELKNNIRKSMKLSDNPVFK